jgi:type 1 fimbriae regulatory protein FimB/type 1 fimbriae regulatory protein FimE
VTNRLVSAAIIFGLRIVLVPRPADRRRAWSSSDLCSPYAGAVSMTERGSPMSVRKMLARTGKEAKFPFLVHPHMLRHACAFKLANDGQDTRALQHYLGHKNIRHMVRYSELSPERFKNFWD